MVGRGEVLGGAAGFPRLTDRVAGVFLLCNGNDRVQINGGCQWKREKRTYLLCNSFSKHRKEIKRKIGIWRRWCWWCCCWCIREASPHAAVKHFWCFGDGTRFEASHAIDRSHSWVRPRGWLVLCEFLILFLFTTEQIVLMMIVHCCREERASVDWKWVFSGFCFHWMIGGVS